MINYGREEKKGENGKIKSGNTNRPIRFDSRRTEQPTSCWSVLFSFFFFPVLNVVWCMHSPYTVMTFPQYNQQEKWTRIPEKKGKRAKRHRINKCIHQKCIWHWKKHVSYNRGQIRQCFHFWPRGSCGRWRPLFRLPYHRARWPFGNQRKVHNTRHTYNLHPQNPQYCT